MKSLTTRTAPVEKMKPTLKRKVGYMEEEVSITRAKLAEMEISRDMDTGDERGKDKNETESNTAAQWTTSVIQLCSRHSHCVFCPATCSAFRAASFQFKDSKSEMNISKYEKVFSRWVNVEIRHLSSHHSLSSTAQESQPRHVNVRELPDCLALQGQNFGPCAAYKNEPLKGTRNFVPPLNKFKFELPSLRPLSTFEVKPQPRCIQRIEFETPVSVY